MRGQLEKKQVKICGIRQNCYALDVRTDTERLSTKSPTIKSYFSLEKKTLPNGYSFEIEKKDYPINSDSVTSYMENSDFRNDPLGAVANAPNRVNLGDITEVQAFIENNPQEAVRLYQAVGEKLKKYYAKQATEQATEQPTEQPMQNTTNGGVTNNG